MVPLSGDAANQIFRDLEDWNRILADTSLIQPRPDPRAIIETSAAGGRVP